jgi:ribose transport system substrate-binding protein
MSARDRCSRRLSRRSVIGATVYAGAGFALFAPTGYRAQARQDAFNVTFIQGIVGDNFYVTMDCGARAKAEDLGNITIDTQAPERFDQTLQTPILNAVVQSQPDAIMMAPNDRRGMIAPIQAAIDAGVPVLCVDTTIESDIQLGDIATDNVEGGRLAARGLAEAIGGSGKVFVVNVKPGISTTDMREEGFRDALENEFPDIEYLGQEYCDDDANIAAQITSARLQSDPDLAGIFGTNLFSAEGAATGLRSAGASKVKIVGFDAGPKQVEDLEQGVVQALIAQKPADIGKAGVEQAIAALKGEPVQKKIGTGFVVVTKENMNDPDVKPFLYKSSC